MKTILIAGLAIFLAMATAIELVQAAEPDNPSVATNEPDLNGSTKLLEHVKGTDPNQPEPPDVTVNGGRWFSNSLTIPIQPSTTRCTYILVGADFLPTNATMLAISGGPVEYTLPDNGDGEYELFMQYSDAARPPQPSTPMCVTLKLVKDWRQWSNWPGAR